MATDMLKFNESWQLICLNEPMSLYKIAPQTEKSWACLAVNVIKITVEETVKERLLSSKIL